MLSIIKSEVRISTRGHSLRDHLKYAVSILDAQHPRRPSLYSNDSALCLARETRNPHASLESDSADSSLVSGTPLRQNRGETGLSTLACFPSVDRPYIKFGICVRPNSIPVRPIGFPIRGAAAVV